MEESLLSVFGREKAEATFSSVAMDFSCDSLIRAAILNELCVYIERMPALSGIVDAEYHSVPCT